MALDEALVEHVARIIYRTQGGSATPEEFEMANGHKLREWKVEGRRWDSDPENELCEWERDDYRFQAEEVLRFLEENKE